MAKDMDMEKGMQQAIAAATDAQVPPMTTGKGEKEPLLLNLQVQPVEAGGVVVAGKMKPGPKKWRIPYWLVVSSLIVVTNSIHASPKYKLIIPPEVAAMVVFLCAICFIFATMLTYYADDM